MRKPKQLSSECNALVHIMAWSRTSRHSRGYGTEWDKTRKRILARDNHLCQACLPRVKAGTHVDHITPKAQGGADSDDNLQTLCYPCHKAKTASDSGKRLKSAIGVDGWPVT